MAPPLHNGQEFFPHPMPIHTFFIAEIEAKQVLGWPLHPVRKAILKYFICQNIKEAGLRLEMLFLLSSGHIIQLAVSKHTHAFMDDPIPRLGHTHWNGALMCHWHCAVYCSACVPEM